MKKEINPLVIVVAAVVVVGLLGYFGYRSFGTRTVDSPDTMPADVKAKMGAAYGGQQRPAAAPSPGR